MSVPLPNSDVVENRREQLRRWIAEKFANSHTAFIASTADGSRQLNQGELSGLLRTKSFGEKKARSLEAQAQMPPGYLDRKPGSRSPAAAPPVALQAGAWPFRTVTPEQFARLDNAQRIHVEQSILLLIGAQPDTSKKSRRVQQA